MSKKTEVIIPEGTEANVIETQGNKRVTYKANVKETENNDETDSELFTNGESNTYIDDTPDQTPIPATPLERMFKRLREIIIERQLQDSFYAYVVRQPDEIGARYNTPCGSEIDLGVFQFTTRDQFNFTGAIQQRNGNSGGVFNVRVYGLDRTPLAYKAHQFAAEQTLGLFNFVVSNPIAEPTPAAAESTGLAAVLNQMNLESAQRHREMIQALQNQDKKHEPTALEKALEQKIIHDLTNPPTPPANKMEDAMANLVLMPIMAERMAKRLFPDPVVPPVPPEPDWLDKADRLAESKIGQMLLPAAANLVDRFGETAQSFAESRMSLNPNGSDSETTANDDETEKTDMQILLERVIDELESERKLDETNELIQNLRADYPDQSDDLITLCQTFPFESVVTLMINKAKKMRPHPFAPFIDMDASQAQGTYVFNERGNKIMPRLKEFFDHIKTLQ